MAQTLERVVLGLLSGSPKCFGHCEENARLTIIREDEDGLVGVYACPSGYVSRVVRYSSKRDLEGFLDYLRELLGPGVEVRPEDIRVATRYNWDLGLGGGERREVVKEHYWVQAYRRAGGGDPNRPGVFMCFQCGALYVQPVSSKNTLCEKCRVSA